MEALQRLHNRGSISTGFNIDNSLKLEADNTEHLYVTTMTSGNRRTWTYSIWFKRTELEFTNVLIHFGVNNLATRMMLDDSDQLWIDICDTGSTNYRSKTNRLFRDTSAWYHVVLRVDTTQSTEADRMKLYVNGVEETSWLQHQIPTQNLDTLANTTVGAYDAMGIGTYVWAGGSYDGQFSGYIAQVAHVDGQSYAATEFGEFDDDTGIWKPKDVSGLTYGTSNNSFLLDFSDASALGNDSSGNNNDWSLSNIAAADQATDTPTNNFCTWNPLWIYSSQPVISEGATKVRLDDSTNEAAKATIGLTNGKWYWEAKPVGSIGSQYIGIQTDGDSNIYSGANSMHNNYTMVINPTGRYYSYSGSQSESADQGWDLTASDWLGIALDMESSTQTIKYYKNGSLMQSLNLISDMQGKTVFPFLINYENRSFDINFGGYTINTISSAASDADGYGTFEYAPPSGYYAICTKNLEEYG